MRSLADDLAHVKFMREIKRIKNLIFISLWNDDNQKCFTKGNRIKKFWKDFITNEFKLNDLNIHFLIIIGIVPE